MAAKAFVRVMNGKIAIYTADSVPGRIVVARVGDEYPRMTEAEWNALPPYSGPFPPVSSVIAGV